MYTIERNAERTASAGRLLYDMYVTQAGLSCWENLRSLCILCLKFYLKELKDRVQKPWALADEKIIKQNIDFH